MNTSKARKPARAVRVRLAAMVCAALPLTAGAVEYNFTLFDQGVDAVFNNTATFGASWRVENREDYLVGKSALDP